MACNVAEQTGEVGRDTASVEAPPAPYFRFPSQGVSVEEGQPLNFTIQRGGHPQIEQEERLFVRISGSADSSDYSAITQGGHVLPVSSGLFEVVFPPGIRNISLQIHVNDDSLYEETERIFLTLVPELTGDNYEVRSHSGFNIEIRNDDPAPIPTFQNATSTVMEGMVRSIQLNLSNPSYRETRSLVKVMGGGANSSDHNFVNQYVTFAPGATTAQINVSAIDEGYNELDEELLLQVYPALGQDYPTTNNQHTLTIQEAGTTPSFEWSVATDTVAENGTLTATVNFTGTFEGDLLVPIVPTGTATLGVDYKLSQQYIYLPLGDSSATVDIIPLNDDIYEGNESIVLTLENQSFAIAGTNSSLTVTLTDDEVPPTLDIPLSSYQTEEGKLVYLPITMTSPAQDHINVNFSVLGSSSATNTNDYILAYSGSFTIYAGSRYFHFPIRIKEDALYEGVETIDITLDSASFQNFPAAVPLANSSVSILIKETANQPTINFERAQINASESDGSFDVTVELDRASEVPLDFSFRTAGEADVPGDYTAPAMTHTILAGNTSYTFPVTMNDDSTHEPRESIIFYLLQPGQMTLGSTKELIVQISDDDDPSIVTVTPDLVYQQEGLSITFTASLNQPSEYNIRVPVSFSGAATKGKDYTVSSEEFYIPAGAPDAKIVVYTIEDDFYDNGDEAVQLDMAPGTLYSLSSPSSSSWITQVAPYNAAPEIFWAPLSSTLNTLEGTTSNATLYLDHATYQDVVVTVFVDDDYNASTCAGVCATIVPRTTPPLPSSENYDTTLHSRISGNLIELVIPQGKTSVQLPIDLVQDGIGDSNESFRLTITNIDDFSATTIDPLDFELEVIIND